MNPKRWHTIGVMAPCRETLNVTRLRRRREGGFAVIAETSVRLKANLLGDAPELVGRELQDSLREAGFRERRYLLAVPPEWMVSVCVPVPGELIGDDVETYLWLQAEQNLPVQTDQCRLSVSRYRLADGTAWATLFAVHAERLTRLETVLQHAGVRLETAVPAAFHCPPGATPPPSTDIRLHRCSAAEFRLQVSTNTGIVALRHIQPVTAAEDAQGLSDRLRRELRIALGQLPPGLAPDATTRVPVSGGWQEQVRASADEGSAAADANWSTTLRLEPAAAGDTPVAGVPAELLLAGVLAPFTARPGESAPPKTARRLVKLAWGVAAAGLLVLAAFAWQIYRARSLTQHLAALAPHIQAVDDIRAEIKALAPWYDQTPRILEILRDITAVFPERGTVWLSSFNFNRDGDVVLSGKARSDQDWLDMQEKLRQCPRVRGLRVSQTRSGTGTPGGAMVFDMVLRWESGDDS